MNKMSYTSPFLIIIRIVISIALAVFKESDYVKGADYPFADILYTQLGFVLAILILNIILNLFLLIYRRSKKLSVNKSDNLSKGIVNIYYLIVVLIIFIMILSLWGIDIKTLFTSLSIIAAAIAIIMKEYITPVIAGFHITLSKELSIGDYVKIGEQKGKIVDLKLNKLLLLDEDDNVIFIPNDKAYASEIINYTKGNIRKVSIPFELPHTSNINVEELESILAEELKEFSDQIIENSFNLKIGDINNNFITFKFQYTLQRADRALEQEIRKKTVRKIANQIKEINVK